MKIIMDMDDARYYETRAVEFIQEAIEYSVSDGDFDFYNKCINAAIGLLTLARLKRGYTLDKEAI